VRAAVAAAWAAQGGQAADAPGGDPADGEAC
jgi:hypothetical protein